MKDNRFANALRKARAEENDLITEANAFVRRLCDVFALVHPLDNQKLATNERDVDFMPIQDLQPNERYIGGNGVFVMGPGGYLRFCLRFQITPDADKAYDQEDVYSFDFDVGIRKDGKTPALVLSIFGTSYPLDYSTDQSRGKLFESIAQAIEKAIYQSHIPPLRRPQ